MIDIKINKEKGIVFYYLVIAIVLFLITKPEAELPMSVRIPLFMFIVIPAFSFPRILPALFVFFYGMHASSFATIMPTQEIFYLFITLICFFLQKKKNDIVGKEFLVLAYFLAISTLYADFKQVLLWGFIAILLGNMIKDIKDLQLLFSSFIFLSIMLCALYLVHRGEFTVHYGTDISMERSSWINPNVFGASIAAGGVLSFSYLTGIIHLPRNILITIVSVASVVLVFVTLSLNASRGALMAFAIPSLVMVLLSKMKLYVKLPIVIVGVLSVLWMYQNSYFDLLLYRIETDETGTGRRFNIFEDKFSAFFMSNNVLYFLFGMGQTACAYLRFYASTHNDFLTSLIAYGIVGFTIFVLTITYPIRKAGRKNIIAVTVMLLYLIIECCVLEPIFRGYLVEIMYFIFVMKYTHIVRKESKIKKLMFSK